MPSRRLLKTLAIPGAALLFLSSALAMPPGLEIDADGSFKAAGLDFAINHYDRNWNPTRQEPGSVKPEAGYPVSSEKCYELKGLFQFGKHPSLVFQEWIKDAGDGAFSYSMSMRWDSPVPTHAICLAANLPVKDFAGKSILVDGKEISLPLSIGDKGGLPPCNAKKITISYEKGSVTIEGNFEASITDKRNFKVSSFDLRIAMKPGSGEISQANLALQFKVETLDSTPLPFQREASTREAAAAETLESAGLKPGAKLISGVKFEIPDPSKEGIIIVGGAKGKASMKLPEGAKGKALCLLANAGEPIQGASAAAFFADGTKQEIPIQFGVDVGSAKEPKRLKNAVVASLRSSGSSYSGIYLTELQLEKDNPIRIEFANPSAGDLRIVAASLATTKLDLAKADSAACIIPGGDWMPFDESGAVNEGSPLDFSAGLMAPAGKFGRVVCDANGHFVAESNPNIRFRFLGQNLCFSAQYLEKSEAEALAGELARQGYNSIRLHHFDGMLAKKDGPSSTELDPAQLDKLDYLFSCLKKRGIYMTIDLYCSRTLKDGELPGVASAKGKRPMKALAPINEAAQENWKAYSRSLLTHKNPYTGMTWAEDPALFGLSLLNENTIYGHFDNKEMAELYIEAYGKWLKEKGLDSKESIESRGPLFVKFMTETHIAMIKDFGKFIREELGYKGLVTDANFRESVAQSLIRNELDFVDNHTYWDHPGFLPGKSWWFPMVFQQQSALSAALIVPKMLFPTRIFGKPFTVTEINYTFPNRYRSEGGPLIGAYAALQDWDAVYRFAWAHDRDSILRQKPINGFDTVRDPINLVADKIAHLMFIRGDVEAAKSGIAWSFSEKSYEGNTITNMIHYSPELQLAGLYCKVGSAPAGAKMPGVTLVGSGKELQAALPPAVKSLMDSNGSCRSEGGQILFDPKRKLFQVVAPRTESFVMSSGSAEGKALKVSGADSFQTITASSIDGEKPLTDSSRILLFQQTDATNAGIKFSSEALSTVEAWGVRQTLLRKGRADVKLALAGKGPWKVTALSLDGSEKGQVESSFANGTLSFAADNSLFGGTLAYLISEGR